MKMGSVIVENGKKVLTMAEYIERKAVLKEAESRIMWGASAAAVYELIRDAPVADVAPVVHGRWIEKEKYTFGIMYDCSLCEDRILDNGRPWKYCPNCGAKMDGCDGNNAMT